MEAGRGQRWGAAALPLPGPGDAPAVVAHTAGHASAALEAAGPRGVVLLSAPGAAGAMGAAWFLALVARAHEGFGERGAAPPPHWAVLDCGDAPGFALSALRSGARVLVLDPAVPAFPAVAAAAAEAGAALWPGRPPALDLGRLDLRSAGGTGQRRLAEWLTGGAVTGPPGLG